MPNCSDTTLGDALAASASVAAINSGTTGTSELTKALLATSASQIMAVAKSAGMNRAAQ
jgi:hypothetical protein